MKSECILKARQNARADSTVSSTTTSLTSQETPSGGQNCYASSTETSAELCSTTTNNFSCHGNELGLTDNQVPMATEELQVLELSDIEIDLNDNAPEEPPLLHINERDLDENGRDRLQEAFNLCLELENSETACGGSFDPTDFTLCRGHSSETELLGAEAEGTECLISPVVSGELPVGCRHPHPGLNSRFPVAPENTGPEPRHSSAVSGELPVGCRPPHPGLSTRFTAATHSSEPEPRGSSAMSGELPGGCIPTDSGISAIFTAATRNSEPEPEPQCSATSQPSGTETGGEYRASSNNYMDAIFKRNRTYIMTKKTEEDLDTQITKGTARSDSRFKQFLMQKLKRGSVGCDSTSESEGKYSDNRPTCASESEGKSSDNRPTCASESEGKSSDNRPTCASESEGKYSDNRPTCASESEGKSLDNRPTCASESEEKSSNNRPT